MVYISLTKVLYLSLLFFSYALYGQEISFTERPVHLQLYPRDALDSATVDIAGTVHTSGYDSVVVQVFKNDLAWKRIGQSLHYEEDRAPFALSPKIHAELAEYDFHIYLDSNPVAQIDSIVCGDVYLINGQSNSHPNASSFEFESEYCRSFGVHTNYEPYNAADTSWGLSTAQGWCDYCPFAVGTWGLKLQQMILEEFAIPTCVINGGSGGSSISYNLPDSVNRMDLSTTYGRLLYRAVKAKVNNDIKAILWHQGESDSYTSEADAYLGRFSGLRTAWHEDFNPLNKIYVFQLHPGNCGGTRQDYLRDVQRRFPESFPEVSVMATVALGGHDGCHYYDEGYIQMAEWVYALIKGDFYQTPSAKISAPMVQNVYYNNDQKTEIAVLFDQKVYWPADTLNASMKDYFYLDGQSGLINNGYVVNDSIIILALNAASSALTLTYLPNHSYNGTPLQIYQGPWIRNSYGIGALSFFEVSIHGHPSCIDNRVKPQFIINELYPNPFNPQTTLKISVNQHTRLQIKIYNVQGRAVRTLGSQTVGRGEYIFEWDGRDSNGTVLPSGMYYFTIKTGEFLTVKKALLIR